MQRRVKRIRLLLSPLLIMAIVAISAYGTGGRCDTPSGENEMVQNITDKLKIRASNMGVNSEEIQKPEDWAKLSENLRDLSKKRVGYITQISRDKIQKINENTLNATNIERILYYLNSLSQVVANKEKIKNEVGSQVLGDAFRRIFETLSHVHSLVRKSASLRYILCVYGSAASNNFFSVVVNALNPTKQIDFQGKSIV